MDGILCSILLLKEEKDGMKRAEHIGCGKDLVFSHSTDQQTPDDEGAKNIYIIIIIIIIELNGIWMTSDRLVRASFLASLSSSSIIQATSFFSLYL